MKIGEWRARRITGCMRGATRQGSGCLGRSLRSLTRTATSTHIFAALETLRVSLYAPKKRRQHPERYTKAAPRLLYIVRRVTPVDILRPGGLRISTG
jgi:hypothetical protein